MDVTSIVSPLNAYLYAGVSDSVVRSVFFIRTADCMASEGWSYWPFDELVALEVVEPNTVGELEIFRQTRGYGFSEILFARPNEQLLDPNEQYRGGLSEQAQAAYDSSLHGPLGEGAIYPAGEAKGCLPRSYAEVTSGVPYYQPEVIDVVTEANSEILASDEYAVARDAWRQCVVSAGYAVDNPNEFRSLVANALRAANPLMAPSLELQFAAAEWPCYKNSILPVLAQLEEDAIATLAEEQRIPPARTFEPAL